MRDAQNVSEVEALGPDLLGMIFWQKSPRHAEGPVSTNVPKVGVFVNEEQEVVKARVEQHKLSFVQLHGAESRSYVEELRTMLPEGVKIIKALSVSGAADVARWHDYDGVVDMLLFDTKCKCVGGSGEQFDWSVLDNYDGTLPFLLSGGIGPDDAERVLSFSHPRMVGIDLNSRFEDAPGVKNVEKLRRFMQRVSE